MVTTSKRWAIALGLMIVSIAVVTQVVWSRARPNGTVVAALFSLVSPNTPAAPGPAVAMPGPGAAPAVATAPTGPSASAGSPAASDKGPAPAAAGPERPRFDVVRVEPDGSMVVAGQAAPNASVTLMVSGRAVSEVRADATGHFAMVPPALPPGGHALTLRQVGETGALDSAQGVAVSVPEKGKAGLVVALEEPGKATKLLAVPDADKAGVASASSPRVGNPSARMAPASSVAIRSVELENGSGFFASGVAPPGTKLRVYLNNSHLADVIASKESSWSVQIRKGLASGHYSVRADASRDGTTRVDQRAEVPFDVPVASPTISAAAPTIAAVAQVAGENASPAPIGSPTDAVIAEVKTAVVHTGDNLWDISRVQLGKGWRYTRIYAANVSQIRDPSLIFPGQVFVMPTHDD